VKKIYFFTLMTFMVIMGQLMGNKVQAQTVQIGTGTEITTSTLYSPLYRFSSTSTTTGARSNIVFTAAEMTAAGIPSGAVISTIAFNKTNSSQFSTGVPFTVYMANTANTTLATTATWANILTTHTSVFTNASYNVPLAAGWVSIAVTPFVYTGGSLEIATEYTLGGATSTANIAWEYSLSTADKVVGVASATGATLNGTVSTYKHRPNIRITYSAGPCTAPPTAGAATSSAAGAVCASAAVTLSLTGNSNGDGQTYVWQSSANVGGPFVDVSASQTTASFVVNPTTTAYYRAAVTCSGQTGFSTPVLVTINPALAGGTYTINSAVATGGSNFQTFGAAVSAISCGITGPVVFNVDAASGPYTEQISLPAITGTSAVNTITFNGNGRTLQFAPVTGARHIIQLNGTDFVTINNLNIVSTSVDFGWGVHLTNAANNNSITNCTINMSATTSTTQSNSAGIVATGSGTSVVTQGDNASNTIITGNTISGAYQGIIMYGILATPTVGNNISTNSISDFYATGIDLAYQSGATVAGNNIQRATRTAVTTFTGIQLSVGTVATLVNANRIHDTHNAAVTQSGTAQGIYTNGADATAGNENKITNNLIYNFNSTTGIQYGLYNSSSDFALFYHNTVLLDNATATSGTTRAFYQLTTATGIEVKNNLLTVKRAGTGTKHVLYFGTSTSTIVSENNNLFINTQTGHSVGFASALTYATFADWQAIGSYDQVSTDIDPVFASPGSGNFTPTLSSLDNTGVDVGVLTDILGVNRDPGAPDVGAYEFAVSGCATPPTPGTAAVTPNGTLCAGTAVTFSLTGNSIGIGQTYQWESSPTSGGTFTTISGVLSDPAFVYNVTATAYYRVAVVCSGQTEYSNELFIQVPTLFPGGTYSINSAVATGGSNFQTFAAALSAISCGIAGPIIFNVDAASGPYTEQISIPAITGTSSTNTITFNGNGRTLQFAPLTGARHIIQLNGADFVTINNLNIVSTALDFGWGVHLTNAANNNSITNCTINISANTSTTQSNSAGIVASGSGTSVTTTGDNASNTVITGNNILGAYQGIILNNILATPSTGSNISNNNISDFYATGIDLSYLSGATVAGNNIQRATRTVVTTFTGIQLRIGSLGTLVNANRIHDTHNAATTQTGSAFGIYLNGADAPAGSENRITNNLIYNFTSATGIQYGLYNSSSDSSLFYHNTVVLDTDTSTSGTTRAFYQITTATGIEVKNNLLSVTRAGTGVKHVLYFGTAGSTIVSNNNNIYINTQTDHHIGFASSLNYTTLGNWQAIGTYDAASTNVAPTFVSPATGDYTPIPSSLNNTGANVGVATDILGTARNGSTPDVGAYEFSVAGCATPPTPGTAAVTPNGTLCITTEVTFSLTGNSIGLGQTYQWESSPTSGGPFTAISGVLTDPGFTYNVLASAYYRVAVVCSGQTAYSNELFIQVPPLFPGGVYTINSAVATGGTNFQTFAAAVSAINCGITGAITFNVDPASGPYNEQITIPQIFGADASNRIVFNGNGRTISFLSTTSAERAGIKLNGADFVTIDNFVITATGTLSTEYGFGIQVLGNADNNIISNNTININTSSNSTNYTGIAIGGSATSATTAGGNADNNVVSGNTITGGYYSITLVGASGILIQNNQVINNIIRDQYNEGVYVAYTNNTLIEKNDISRPTRTALTTFSGVYFINQSLNAKVSKNKIHDPFQAITSSASGAYGVFFSSCDATAGNENVVSNNLIYNFIGGGIQYGLYNSGSDSVRYYHNTINLDDAAYTGTSATRGFYQITTANGLEIRNNIFRISRAGAGTKYLLYFGATTTASTILSNHNDLYISSAAGTNGIGFQSLPSVTATTLSAWQTGSSQDANSVTIEPLFVDAAAGNLAPRETALDNLGTPSLNILTDVLDVVRSVTTPDMGAYEYVGSILPVKLTAIVATKVKNDVQVGWTTATEINSSSFDIERSVDGANFIKAGTTLSNNNINGSAYSFTDLNAALLPNSGTLYYRLKMIDMDGSFSYSPVVIVKLGNQQTPTLEALRNPFAGAAMLKLYVDRTQPVKVSIADLQGKVLMTESRTFAAGVHLVTVKNSDQLASGMYIAIVEVDGVRHAVRLVKQ
jgi:parallel beta-helix repeat protein